MKKIICTIPLQISDRALEKVVYDVLDNKKLEYKGAVSFPIISVINGYVEKGEKIEILVLQQAAEGTDSNYIDFQKQVSRLCNRKNIKCMYKVIDIVFDESSGTHLKTFLALIENIEEKDDLYACMTYGTKPIPIVEMMALNYAYRNLRQVHVGCIVYGQKSWKKNTHVIYDITSLFVMDEVVHEFTNYIAVNDCYNLDDVIYTKLHDYMDLGVEQDGKILFF